MDQEKIGKLIAESRKKAGLTQQELALKLNITDRAVSKWETGRSLPDISLLKDLSAILNVSVNDILNGEKVIDAKDNKKTIEKTLTYSKKFTEDKIQTIFKNGALLYTALSLLAIIIVLICDYCINGTLSWSIISNSSIIYAWTIIFIFMISKEQKIKNALYIITVCTIPFIYILSLYFKMPIIFKVGILSTIYSLIYLWLTYYAFKIFNHRKMLATAIVISLTVPLTLAINMTLNCIFQDGSYLNFWDILSISLEFLTALIILIFDNLKRKNLSY